MTRCGKWLYVAGMGWFLAAAMPAIGAEQAPDQAVSSSGGDWLAPSGVQLREMSPARETEYVDEIRAWLKTLQPVAQARARQILREAHPGLHDLRKAIYDKKAELAALSFDSRTEPETLPRLGQELQLLRRALRAELEKVNNRLRTEAGVSMGPLAGEGFWLQPLPKNGGVARPGRKDSAIQTLPLSFYSPRQ